MQIETNGVNINFLVNPLCIVVYLRGLCAYGCPQQRFTCPRQTKTTPHHRETSSIVETNSISLGLPLKPRQAPAERENPTECLTSDHDNNRGHLRMLLLDTGWLAWAIQFTNPTYKYCSPSNNKTIIRLVASSFFISLRGRCSACQCHWCCSICSDQPTTTVYFVKSIVHCQALIEL